MNHEQVLVGGLVFAMSLGSTATQGAGFVIVSSNPFGAFTEDTGERRGELGPGFGVTFPDAREESLAMGLSLPPEYRSGNPNT